MTGMPKTGRSGGTPEGRVTLPPAIIQHRLSGAIKPSCPLLCSKRGAFVLQCTLHAARTPAKLVGKIIQPDRGVTVKPRGYGLGDFRAAGYGGDTHWHRHTDISASGDYNAECPGAREELAWHPLQLPAATPRSSPFRPSAT
jgi:hypothetical protein